MRAVGIFKNAHPVLFGQMFDRIHEIIEDVLRTHYDNIDKQKKEHRPGTARFSSILFPRAHYPPSGTELPVFYLSFCNSFVSCIALKKGS